MKIIDPTKYREYKQKNRIIWEAQAGGQQLFLSCPNTIYERFIGGTRGSGKTDSILMLFGAYVDKGFGPDWRGIIFRRTYTELADAIAKSKKWFYQAFPGARFNESKHVWIFPNGEFLRFGYMRNINDYWAYHGHEFPFIFFEEMLAWATNECYERMKSCNRSSREGMPRIYGGSGNPYGPGHAWVKQYFVDPDPPCTPITDQQGNKRVYIPSYIEENKILINADPTIIQKLDAIKDPNLKKAWRWNRWDISIGGFFTDVWDENKHIIRMHNKFTPPLRRGICFRSFDWGSAKPFHVGWWWESDGVTAPNGMIYPRGALILFYEWYGNDKNSDNPNTGLRMDNKLIGKGIFERENMWPRIKIQPGPADPSIFNYSGNETIASQVGNNLFIPADNSRIPGWQQVRGRLIGDQDKGPMLYIMEHCRDTIRILPTILRDEKNLDDIDTEMEDHAVDSLRYACCFRKYKATIVEDAYSQLGYY